MRKTNPYIFHQLERAELISQESDALKKRVSKSLRMLHKQKIAKGQPENYVLTVADICAGLNLEDYSKLQNLLHRCYGSTSLPEVLEGLELPAEKKLEQEFNIHAAEKILGDFIARKNRRPSLKEASALAAEGNIPPQKEFLTYFKESYNSMINRLEAKWLTRNIR